MELDKQFIDKLIRIDWFINCGKDIPCEYGVKLKSGTEAIDNIMNVRWQNIILDNRGDLTAQLSMRSCKGEGKEYQEWNKLVREIKESYMPDLERVWNERLSTRELNKSEVLADIRFNVLALIMVDVYKSIIPVTAFWKNLLEIYEAGYLPCGWKGKKADGKFMIY